MTSGAQSELNFMQKIVGCFLVGWLFSATGAAASAAVWQWSVSVDSISLSGPNEHPRAFLWIPPDCRQVRAAVLGQYNLLEDGILEDPAFRRTLAKLGIAEILIAPTFDTWQNATNNEATNRKFDALLKSLGDESGYTELTFAPIIPIGHSAMATFPWDFAAWNPQRTLAVLSVHGDAPLTHLTGNGRPNADWGGHNLDGVPGLMVMGQYEWWEDRLTPAFAFEAKYPSTPVAFFCDVGNGHFNYSDQLVNYLGMFIRKAVEWRLPARAPLDQPLTLRPVNPSQGWLIDRWRNEERPIAPAAPYAKYSGNRSEAFWCFDREMARETGKYYERARSRLPQLTGIIQNGKSVPIDPRAFELIRLPVPPLDSTLTFHLHGTFLDTVPGGTPQAWTGLTNGTPVGHATGRGPVTVSRITGPVEQTGPDTFAIRFNRLSMPSDRRMGDIWLVARHPGDARYRNAVEQALMKIPFRLTDGADQQIHFPAIADQKAGIKSLMLNAASSAGVPVYYYVREGPAEMDGATLKFTKIPPRTKFPAKVTVVAWQYGRNIEPRLKTAEPVEQTFSITP